MTHTTERAETGLLVGATNTIFEQQADAMANQVMRMPEQSLVQRKCAHCEEEKKAQRMPLTSFIQRKADVGQSQASPTVSSRIEASRGGGSPLPVTTQTFMESRFGADFGGVRIHTGSEAGHLSAELNAQAFTVGSDIYFNQGKFAPESASGQHLLAHELTHTIQQGGEYRATSGHVQRQTPAGTTAEAPVDHGLTGDMLHQIARRLRNAMAGWGTDEEAIFSAIAGRTQAQINAIDRVYQELYDRPLLTDLQDELTDGEMRHLAMFSPQTGVTHPPENQLSSRANTIATQLNSAMAGWGTDEESIISTLTGRTQSELAQIKEAYTRLTHHMLEADLRDELSGTDLIQAMRLLNQGVLAPEDELYLAMAGLGTDEDTIFRVLTPLAGNATAITSTEANYRTKYGDLIADLRGDLSGEEYARAIRILGPVVRDVAFEDCNESVIQEVRSFIPHGINRVEHAISVLSKGLAGMTGGERAVFQQFFDPSNSGFDQQFVSDVLANFRRIRHVFTDDLTVECETDGGLCTDGRLYYTYWGNIHVCAYFTHETDSNRKARDFVHELAHNAMLAVDRPYYSSANSEYNALTPRGPWTTRIPVVGSLFQFISRTDTLYHPDAYSWFAFHVP